MKKSLLIAAAFIAVLAASAYGLHKMNHDADARYIQMMETKTTFTQDEVDVLYRWHIGKDDGVPSKRFEELYAKKIAPL